MVTEVLLMTDVKSLGDAGAVVKVYDGYARNFLFPKKLAAPVSAATQRRLAKLQADRESTRKLAVDAARDGLRSAGKRVPGEKRLRHLVRSALAAARRHRTTYSIRDLAGAPEEAAAFLTDWITVRFPKGKQRRRPTCQL